jgi:hypothetical protein
MTKKMSTLPSAAALALASLLAGACGQSTASEVAAAPRPPAPTVVAAAATEPTPQATTAGAAEAPEVPAVMPAGGPVPAAGGAMVFTGAREQTEQFIRDYETIALTPEQERIKVEALSKIPAPCCADNPLATCCCPCNLAKAAWGMAARLITEHGYGVEEVRQAAVDWLAVANPGGFTGNACYSGGCGRPIHQNGCGGMDARHVL